MRYQIHFVSLQVLCFYFGLPSISCFYSFITIHDAVTLFSVCKLCLYELFFFSRWRRKCSNAIYPELYIIILDSPTYGDN